MEKFVIDKTDRKMSSISRTIRMKEETFDRINEINRQTGVSFNKIVNQCIEYALAHYDDEWSLKNPEQFYFLFRVLF